MLSRHEVAKKLGRRVSRGERERLFNLLFEHRTRVTSCSRGKQTGAVRVTRVLHPHCPKAKRKHGLTGDWSNVSAHERKTSRARYVFT